MAGEKKYIFNEQTQSYEIDRRSARAALYKTGAVLLAGLACFLLYYYFGTEVWGFDTPKAQILEHRNRILAEEVSLLDGRIQEQDEVLLDLSLRDNLVYRLVFCIAEIPREDREAGLGGDARPADGGAGAM